MVHYLGIVLVIWGLLAQPLMAALPRDMQVHLPIPANALKITLALEYLRDLSPRYTG